MKKPIVLPILLLALPLVACTDTQLSSSPEESGSSLIEGDGSSSLPSSSADGEGSSSTSSSTSLPDSGNSDSTSEPVVPPEPELPSTLTFEEAYALLASAAAEEGTASRETRRQADTTTTDSSITYVEEETLDIYEDGSASAEGTVTSFAGEEKTASTSLLRRKALASDLIYDSLTQTALAYDLYYEVSDYADDSFRGSVYQDAATRVFVLDSPDPGLDSSDYILKSDIPQAVTYQHTSRTAGTIAAWEADPYVSQTGVDSFELTESEEAVGTYATRIEYVIDGDLDDTITYVYEMEFTLDFEAGRLLECLTRTTQTDVSNSDPTDVYMTVVEDGGSIEYGTRSTLPGTAVDPHDYFLQDVSEIAVLDAGREEVDPSSFPRDSSFIFALPKVYEPSKALALDEWSLTPVETSDETVVALDGGYFEVVGYGDVTLTWSYFGCDADGVWTEKTVQKAIHINEFDDPTGIDIYAWNIPDTMVVGEEAATYVWVTPSTAEQTFEAISSDEDVLTVTADLEAGEVTVTAVGAGEATIAVAVPGTNLKDEVTVTVVAPAEMTPEEFLTSNYFVIDDDGTTSEITIHFYEDGTGYEKEEGSAGVYEYNFEWSVDGRTLSIDNWSPELNGGYDVFYAFYSGTISPNFDRLTLEMEGHDFEFAPVPLE